jgi:hypothetical protein
MTSCLRNVCFLSVALVMSASFNLARAGTMRVEQNDASITYSGNWYTNGSLGNSGSSATLTNAAGARAVITFTGTAITWIGVADPWSGLANVYLDGAPYRVDTYGNTTRYQERLFTASGLSIGAHTLSIEVTHERDANGQGSWVWIDAFDIQDGQAINGGVTATVGRVQENNPALIYTGGWYSNVNAVHSGGSAALALGDGSQVSINFNGTGIAWIAYRDQWSGVARVYLDGVLKTTFDTYLSPSQAQTAPYRIEGLPPGNHTLTIEATGTRNESSGGAWVWVDAFDVAQ